MALNNSPGVILQGLGNVMANLNKEIQAIENRSMKGLILCAALVRSDMEKTPPTIPVDLGNLRSSWFVVTAKSRLQTRNTASFKGKDAGKFAKDHTSGMAEAQSMMAGVTVPVLIMGFTANYAMWVHEMLGNVSWNRPGSGAKYFEYAIKRNTPKMLKIIKDNAQIK